MAVALVVSASAAWSSEVLTTATGVRAEILSPHEIVSRWVTRDATGRSWLTYPGVAPVELETAAHDWSQLTPVPSAVVMAALSSMQGFTTHVTVQIFLLPGLPAATLGSFSRDDAIFLAPTVGPTSEEAIAYVTTHEMGHVLTWAALDGRPQRWQAYLELRGVPATAFGDAVPHAERAREILAEDLRALFGGELATRSGTIENGRLPLPDSVPGLRALLVNDLADPDGGKPIASAGRAYPNPANPRTTIALLAGHGPIAHPESAVLEIFDARGARVRVIRGGIADGAGVQVAWDGLDDGGRSVASGIYHYRLTAGDQVARGRVALVR